MRKHCAYKEIEIIEVVIRPNHIHMVALKPPKYSTAQINGIFKGEKQFNDIQKIYEYGIHNIESRLMKVCENKIQIL